MKEMNHLLPILRNKLKILKNKNFLFGFVSLIVLLFLVVFRSSFFPNPYVSTNNPRLQKISSDHWMGTDETGYDLFARVLEGAKISLQIGFCTIIISSFIGACLGIISGYFQGFLDNIIIFICDFLTIIPDIILAVFIMLFFKNNDKTISLTIVLIISYIPSYVRILRADTLIVKQKDFVKASKALGANDIQIIKKHIITNILANLITKMVLNMSSVILAITGLNFIGLGLKRNQPEWGNILFSSKDYFASHPHLFIGPFIIIFITIFSFDLIGKSLIVYFEKK